MGVIGWMGVMGVGFGMECDWLDGLDGCDWLDGRELVGWV